MKLILVLLIRFIKSLQTTPHSDLLFGSNEGSPQNVNDISMPLDDGNSPKLNFFVEDYDQNSSRDFEPVDTEEIKPPADMKKIRYLSIFKQMVLAPFNKVRNAVEYVMAEIYKIPFGGEAISNKYDYLKYYFNMYVSNTSSLSGPQDTSPTVCAVDSKPENGRSPEAEAPKSENDTSVEVSSEDHKEDVNFSESDVLPLETHKGLADDDTSWSQDSPNTNNNDSFFSKNKAYILGSAVVFGVLGVLGVVYKTRYLSI